MSHNTPAAAKDGWAEKRGLASQLKCAILAAGLGRRLEPLTARHLPKPLFPLGGRVPIAEIWVRRMVEAGIRDISMNLCVLAETIERHFGNGSRLGASITYVQEQTPSGTLGGVCKQALGRVAKTFANERPLTAEPFQGSTLLAPSGDVVTNFSAALLEEMYDIHTRSGAAFTMVLVPVPWERRKDFGTVLLEGAEKRAGLISRSGRIVDFLEKDPNSPSNLNNASIYMLEMDLLRELDALRTPASLQEPQPFYDFGKHVFPAMLGRLPHGKLSRDYPLWGIEYDGAWFDVGQKRDYLEVHRKLLDGELDVPLPFERQPWGFLGTDSRIHPQANIVAPVVIGNHCVIEAGATIGPHAIIGDGWTVEGGASVKNSVLWESYPYFDESGSEIPAAARRTLDPHRVAAGVTVDGSIVTGGQIDRDLADSTAHVDSTGKLTVFSIDWVPGDPRA
ncbi:MAG: NDP-sugar synthase [Planctomycetales bacterium]|nr:NDP-sugar synthase [Planctomycetales bacterium]